MIKQHDYLSEIGMKRDEKELPWYYALAILAAVVGMMALLVALAHPANRLAQRHSAMNVPAAHVQPAFVLRA
jgi:hypothetical protein